MLTREQNELLTRTGSGTPMGEYLRQFWIPVFLPEELPEPDCTPVRMTLMGEDLVGFRDTSGKVGLLSAYCAHRHAHLFWGRNEECGLRCVYHGWKYDVTGQCVDMPSEPPESNFKQKIRITAYPTEERAGIIWAYMGPKDRMPDIPDLEWTRLPEAHVVASKSIQNSNYAQALEGGIDSSHISFLHYGSTPATRIKTEEQAQRHSDGQAVLPYTTRDTFPRFFVKDTDYGMLIGARRNAEENSYYWRVSQFLLPWYTIIPGGLEPGLPLGGHAWVPLDDTHCWRWTISWNVQRPFTPEEVGKLCDGSGAHSPVIPGTFTAVLNKENDYLIDREEQRLRTFTGIEGNAAQDYAVQESMGAIVPRWEEHLGLSDTAVIKMRQRLLKEARDFLEGVEPVAAMRGDLYRVRSGSAVLKEEEDFDQVREMRERLKSLV